MDVIDLEDALKGSATLCRIAEEKTGIPVIQMDSNDFEKLDMYDGIWACSSILHLSRQELKQVLVHMEQALHKKVIRMEDLEGFGDDLIEAVKLILSR